MKFLLKYLTVYKKESILAPVFKMLEAVFELLVPLVMAAVIDEGIARLDSGYVVRMCAVLIFLGIAGLAFSITAQYFAAKAAIGCASELRRDLFAKILSFSNAGHDAAGAAALTTRMTNDINQVQNGVNMFLRLFLRSPFIVAGAVIMAFVVNAKAALVFVAVIPVLGGVIYLVMTSTLPIFREIQMRVEGILQAVGDNLEGARVVRAFGTEEREIKSFEERTAQLCDRQMRAGKISALLNPVTYVIVNLGVVVVLWFAGGQVNAGMIAQGEVVALCNYMSQILVELIKLANLIVLLTRGITSIGRIEEVMAQRSDEREHPKRPAVDAVKASGDAKRGSDDPLIELRDVTFSYPGAAEPSLEHISLKVYPGETLGIIGGTGSGKSSLLKLLYHGYEVSAGSILFAGREVKEYSDEELSRWFGVVPQKASLFHGTIAENLAMGREDYSREDMWRALETAQAREIVEKKSGQLAEMVEQGGRNFSGGQRQRLTIARALLGQPEVLLLDDAASALDLATEAALWRALHALPQKPAILLVSQRASSVKKADRILVLEDGRCSGLGTHEELLSACRVYQEIYDSQFPREEEEDAKS